jgi:hypothetical protein
LEILDKVKSIQIVFCLAQSELKAFLVEAATERKKFLQLRETAATIASNPKEALKWKNLQRAEKIKQYIASCNSFVRITPNSLACLGIRSQQTRLTIPRNATTGQL